MTELTRTRAQKKISLLKKHGIKSFAAPTPSDRRKLDTLSREELDAMFEEDLLSGLHEPARRVPKEEIRARVLKRMGLDG